MKKLYFFLFFVFFIRTKSQIKKNPIFLVEAENIFVLSTNDDYYYVLTTNKDFKIKKESGDIETISNNTFNISDYKYLEDKAYNNYLYKHTNNEYYNRNYKLNFEYYQIIYNSFVSYKEITSEFGKKNCSFNMETVGGIAKDKEVFIYGYSSNLLLFIRKFDNNCVNSIRKNINEKLSCKIIENGNFVCAMIIKSVLEVFCFKYTMNLYAPDALTPYINSNPLSYDSISSFGLYDTNNNYIKLLCRQNNQKIYCKFFKIVFKVVFPIQSEFGLLGDEKLIFTEQNNFKEKNCYLSNFNSEYLFCCAITNYIQCYRINCNNYNVIKQFNLSIKGDNFDLTIKSNIDYSTFFFINYYNDKYSVYEYYIYVPSCQDKNYTIFNNSLNDNDQQEGRGRLSNLFTVKTNDYYFEINNSSNEYGYFTLNNEMISGRTIISNNDYILDFVVINIEIIRNIIITVKYTISVEYENAYSEECQLTLNFSNCYKSCEICSKNIDSSNETQHNCIKCWENYYFSPGNNSNCYLMEEKKNNWYFDSNTSKFELCHEECKSCSGPNRFDCTSCYNGLYLDKGCCASECSPGYFIIKIQTEQDDYFLCRECHPNCETCSNSENFMGMNCATCKENQIKYNDNCYEIDDPLKKTFLVPNDSDINNQTSSCFQKFGLYIKEDFNECIPLPNDNEGYYLSFNETGLLSKCHDNCLSCYQGPLLDISGYIKSMECLKCKDSNNSLKAMIKMDNNCFKIIQYDETRILFNISEINHNKPLGSCMFFGKAIYYGEYNCIDKPENSYYVLKGDENTGVIKDFFNDLDYTYLENEMETEHEFENTFKSYESDIFFETFKSNIEIEEELEFINKEEFITEKHEFEEIKNSHNINNFLECDLACLTCDKTKEKNNLNCLKCNTEEGYYPIFESPSNCYNHATILKNYYLDMNESLYVWKKCYEKCETCLSQGNSDSMNCLSCTVYPDKNMYLELIDGNCINKSLNLTFIVQDEDRVSISSDGTYLFPLNNSFFKSYTNNTEFSKNKYIITFDNNISIFEFKNKIRNENIISFVNSSRVINGSDFLAIVLSSHNINPEIQIKNGISAIDLGNCTYVLKEYYNISKEENLIIMNMEIKNDFIQKNEDNVNDDNSFILGKNTFLEIYDYSGRQLNLSICKEDIKIMKYIGDIKELDINSAMILSKQGIDVFNAEDNFFNDICSFYDSSDGKDIIINDRRNDFYQNATFCQYGCTYNGMNYSLMVANCICKPKILQEVRKNITEINKEIEFINFKALSWIFLENIFNFNFEILRCYNLVLNRKILVHNIGFYSLMTMLVFQIIFVFVHLLKRLNSLKYFLMKFGNKNCNKNKNKRIINIINNKKSKNICNKNNSKKKFLAIPPKKSKSKKRSFNYLNKIINDKIEDSSKILNKKSSFRAKSNKNSFISNKLDKLDNNIYIHDIYKKKNLGEMNNLYKKQQRIKDNKIKNIKFISIHNNNFIYNIKQNEQKQNHHFKGSNKLYQTIYDLQDMNYEKAIFYDKRGYLKIYLGFLIDTQIILGTFCTDNHFDLFVIKLSFLVYTFQMSFFLNAFFYTDEYISDAYHNNGVLDFFSGLSKSIYSLIATLITTNLLRMLSTIKSELMYLIRVRQKYNTYVHLIHQKLSKLRNKLVLYFILVYIFSLFFLYYVTAFCAVYRNSQKYWFYGCLESFGMDSLISFGICIILAFFRYISIKRHIKCFYILANIISSIL